MMMSESEETPPPVQLTVVPPPPPPPPKEMLTPPPPPPPADASRFGFIPCSGNSTNIFNAAKKGIVHEQFSTVEEQARKACQWFIKDQGLTEEKVRDFVFLSSYQPVKPVIQNGPLCGMVALAMASELTGGKLVSTEDIFEEAKQNGFSLQGEMFSASSMQKLAAKFLDCEVKLVTMSSKGQTTAVETSRIIIDALLEHYFVLMPYDADKNHGPCQAKGHKAHWALITGFFSAFKKGILDEVVLTNLRQDKEIDSLYYVMISDKFDDDVVTLIAESSIEFKLFMHQGKSKYCGLWRLQDVLDSNDNLVEVGPDRDSSEYLVPAGDVKEGLKCKAVFICPTAKS